MYAYTCATNKEENIGRKIMIALANLRETRAAAFTRACATRLFMTMHKPVIRPSLVKNASTSAVIYEPPVAGQLFYPPEMKSYPIMRADKIYALPHLKLFPPLSIIPRLCHSKTT